MDPSKPQEGLSDPSDLPADHAEADSSNSAGEEVGISGPGVSASSELITPEIEKLLPSAARRVSILMAAVTFAKLALSSGQIACTVCFATDSIQVGHKHTMHSFLKTRELADP